MAKYLGELELLMVDKGKEDNVTTFKFLNDETNEIREVVFFKDNYNRETKKFEYNQEQFEKYTSNLKQYLNVTPDTVLDAIGKTFPVWSGEKYDYLWEPAEFYEFPIGFKDQNFEAVIENIWYDESKEGTSQEQTRVTFVLKLKDHGKLVKSNMNWGEWVPSLKRSFTNPRKKSTQMEKFAEKFGVTFQNRNEIIGKDVKIEVKSYNFGGKSGTYIDIKPFPMELPFEL